MDVDIDPHWNTVMYQLIEVSPLTAQLEVAYDPQRVIWRTSHTRVDQARTSFAKKVGNEVGYNLHIKPIQIPLNSKDIWCPKARGEPQVFPGSHGWDSPLYLPWTIASKSTYLKWPHIPFFWLWSRQLLWTFRTFWDEEIPGTWDRKDSKDRNLEADCQPQLDKLKCLRLLLVAIMKQQIRLINI